jgi:PAS domain S-box-containing protein
VAAGSKRGRKAPPRARRKPHAPVNLGDQAQDGGEQLELAMRALNESVYDWDIARNRFTPSRSMARLLGLTAKRITLKAWQKAIHPEDYPGFRSATVEHLKGRSKRFEYDYRYRDRRGKWRWARTHGVAIRDKQGRAVRMFGSTGDITEIKRVEQALKESEQRYALATQAATEGIYEWNLAAGSLFLSDRAKTFFGVKDAKLTPAAWNARVHRDDFPGYRAALAANLKGGTPQFEHEYRIRNTAGGHAWVVDRAAAVRDEKGRVVRLVGALADVTQRKLAEIELRRARDEATAALERQTATAEILSAMSGSIADTQPVFDAIAKSCSSLFIGSGVSLRLVRDGVLDPVANIRFNADAVPVDRGSVLGACVLDGRSFHLPDLDDAVKQFPRIRQLGLKYGYHSGLYAPMMRGGVAIGAIAVLRPQRGAFGDKEIDVLKTSPTRR